MRFVGTIMSALTLLSLASTWVEWQQHVAVWIDAWRSVTRPVWDFLLGWLFSWIGWELPWWVKDYLTMAVVCAAGFSRAFSGSTLIASCFLGLFWPATMFFASIWAIVPGHWPRNERELDRFIDKIGEDHTPSWVPPMFRGGIGPLIMELVELVAVTAIGTEIDRIKIFWHSFAIALVVIGINYALIQG